MAIQRLNDQGGGPRMLAELLDNSGIDESDEDRNKSSNSQGPIEEEQGGESGGIEEGVMGGTDDMRVMVERQKKKKMAVWKWSRRYE